MQEENYTALEKAQIKAQTFAFNFGTNMLLYSSLINLVNERNSYETEQDVLRWRGDERDTQRLNEIDESITSIDAAITLIVNDQIE